MLQKRAQAVQPRVPEFLVALEPFERAFHGAGLELAAHDPADLFAFDEPGILENGEMLDDAGQRHADRRGQLADRALAVPEPDQDRAPRRIGERAEDGIEPARRIVNHKVKCAREFRASQAAVERKGICLRQARRPGGSLSTTVHGKSQWLQAVNPKLPPYGQKFTPVVDCAFIASLA